MPIFTYTCNKCGQFEEIFLTFEKANKKKNIKCPKCGKKSIKNEFDTPAKFMGCFGVEPTAPSKRYTYKKSLKSPDPNRGSAV